MNKLTITLLLFLLPVPGLAQEPYPTAEWLEKARTLVQRFSSSLQSALQSAIEDGGLTNAIAVCKVVAPEIAANNSDAGWSISRTALKIRNPDNRPTTWQKVQLEAMEGQPVRDGRPVEVWQVSTTAAGPPFKYMSAIPTGGLCLNCHGNDLQPEVESRLNELYPQDEATGFMAGDLRGAFVVTYQPDAE